MKPNQDHINAFLKFVRKIKNHFGDLADRWEDEHKYEDIEDYRKSLQKESSRFGVTITKMNRRPFGCQLKLKGCKAVFWIKATDASLEAGWFA